MPLAPVLVHVFTALGAVCALFAALAIPHGDWVGLFFWLGIALFIDGIDGTFARMADVEARLPRFSGETLDLVIDYVTYVFVPVLALLAAGHLRGSLGEVLAAGILLSSLYHFSDNGSKDEEKSFVGFPAIWNVVAFYIFVFQPDWKITAAIIATCTILTFFPWRWVHPLRVVRMRPVTLAMTLVWSVAAALAVWQGLATADVAVKAALLGVALYAVGLALWKRG
jgi:phosphatidylcholine synthase